MLGRIAIFVYGVASYALFFGTFLYAIGFVANFATPTSLDAGASGPLGMALLVNLALLTVFALQHSIMARPAFKRAWTRIVPEPAERSTYVLLSSIAMILLFAFWQPMGGIVWDVADPSVRALLQALCMAGFLLVLVATFLINHFDLFGLRQVWLHLLDRPYTHLPFRTPGPYRLVRHPLYVGWLIAFWAAPTMTVAHLVFALATTGYILIAIQFEEADLEQSLGDDYGRYRRSVGMLWPRRRRASGATRPSAQTVA
jgi:protein-S-isoprenylcysteine O-methyltransferase Ste14